MSPSTEEQAALSGTAASPDPIRRQFLKTFGTLIAAIPVLATASCERRQVRWVVFYGETASEQALSPYDIVILDPSFKGSIAAVARGGARVCAYLSLGEIRKTDPFYNRIAPAALLEENPAWPGTHRVDIRHPSWRQVVLEEILPAIVLNGFTGVMLDTLDTPLYLEQLEPTNKHGMEDAAVRLVQAIRESRPDMLIILNRTYPIISKLVHDIDYLLAESLLTAAEGCCGIYKWNPPSEVTLQLSLLSGALKRRPSLPILSLDYWDPEDVNTVQEIYRRERLLGHHPYVATRMLDTLCPEPKPRASSTGPAIF